MLSFTYERDKLIETLDKYMGALLTGPDLTQELLLIDGVLDRQVLYIDNFRSARELVNRTENLPSSCFEYETEMLLPLPDESKLSTDDFLAPFPFTVEMPILNLGYGIQEKLPSMLDDLGQCKPKKLKAS